MPDLDIHKNIYIKYHLYIYFFIFFQWSKASSYVIRFRSCQLLYLILTDVLDSGEGEIDAKTYDQIAALIEARSKDVSANVRSHSVLLAKFFQDPSDHDDPVISGTKKFIFRMQYLYIFQININIS